MQAFLDRYYANVNRHTSDPTTSRRMPNSDKFLELQSVERMLWEDLLKISSSQNTMGRAEATIALVADTRHYRLPGNFRKFLSLEKRISADPDDVEHVLHTIDTTHPGPGVEIISPEQGMVIRPVPDASIAGDWTLVYQRGPLILHQSTMANLNTANKTFEPSLPLATDAGELVLIDDYYNGCQVRIYSATKGAGQVNEIVDYDVSGTTPLFTYRHAWTTAPTGTILYEISPLLPPDLDELYAIEVAIRVTGRRTRQRVQASLARDRTRLWNAAKHYFGITTLDRGISRVMQTRQLIVDPYR